jgi:enamine deaminase RidA (YjgF/YER057c/UK114 family)
MAITHLNPSALHANPAFSHGVHIQGGSLVVVGGQNGTNADGEVASGDLGEQTAQALRNVLAVLA